ncbi:Alpha/Beta hydrolase protein [Xylaria arbuscula]|nr:Alpha/Beta hydrolase protein [Xylaria arbuscula]
MAKPFWKKRQPESIFPDGIKVWNDNKNAIVDVCFVHGLTGDRDKTWTAEGQPEPWPTTLLAQKLPQARLLTYGYDAYFVKSSVASTNNLFNHGINFLNDLTNDRHHHRATSRPIIFVAHSLGGLVCKVALTRSRNNADKHLQAIFDKFIGIVFMGTPHHGSWMTEWGLISVKALGIIKSVNDNLLQVLKVNNQHLELLQAEFTALIRGYQEAHRHPAIACFYEELPLSTTGKVVVTQTSATIDGYASLSIHADHRNMVKFSSSEENGFKRLFAQLERSTPLRHAVSDTINKRGMSISLAGESYAFVGPKENL